MNEPMLNIWFEQTFGTGSHLIVKHMTLKDMEAHGYRVHMFVQDGKKTFVMDEEVSDYLLNNSGAFSDTYTFELRNKDDVAELLEYMRSQQSSGVSPEDKAYDDTI